MSDFSFSGGAGGAATGAGIGSAILPGIGTAVGGVLGFLGGGLFGGPKPAETYKNPYKGQIDQQAQELLNSNLGKQEAADTTGIIRRQAKDNLEEMSNAPTLGNNAAVRSRLSAKIGNQADEGIIHAQLGGAELDNQNKARGLQLLQQQQGFDYSDFQRTSTINRQPSPMESLGYEAMGTIAGEGLSKAFSKDASDTSGGDGSGATGIDNLANGGNNSNPLGYKPQGLSMYGSLGNGANAPSSESGSDGLFNLQNIPQASQMFH